MTLDQAVDLITAAGGTAFFPGEPQPGQEFIHENDIYRQLSPEDPYHWERSRYGSSRTLVVRCPATGEQQSLNV